MTLPILVTGGTGTLGRHVVPRLRDAGSQVRVLSRRSHEPADGIEYTTGDLATGAELERAVAGVETIVHLAGSAKGDDDKARNLVQAASRTGVRHLVYISVVGADRIPVVSGIDRTMFGYFAAKRAAEQIVAGSDVPWTTLRATQFYDLTLATIQQMTKLPVIPAPSKFRFQPIDTDEVAARLVDLSLGRPSGLVPDMGGPRVYGMDELVRSYLRAGHRRRPIMPVWLPGKAAGAIRAGANLAPDRAVGHRTWEDFLAEQLC
ncbi:MAG: SDR family oxidoreductase [Dehalococcoidia bacterium]